MKGGNSMFRKKEKEVESYEMDIKNMEFNALVHISSTLARTDPNHPEVLKDEGLRELVLSARKYLKCLYALALTRMGTPYESSEEN